MLYVWQRLPTTIREPGRPTSSHTVRSPVSLSSTVLVGVDSSALVGADVVCRLIEGLLACADCASSSRTGERSAVGFELESAVAEESTAAGVDGFIVALEAAAGVGLSCARLAPVPSAERTPDMRHWRDMWERPRVKPDGPRP